MKISDCCRAEASTMYSEDEGICSQCEELAYFQNAQLDKEEEDDMLFNFGFEENEE